MSSHPNFQKNELTNAMVSCARQSTNHSKCLLSSSKFVSRSISGAADLSGAVLCSTSLENAPVMNENDKRRFDSFQFGYCSVCWSSVASESPVSSRNKPEPHIWICQTPKAVRTTTDHSAVQSNKVWPTEMLQRFTGLDWTLQNSCIPQNRYTGILCQKKGGHTLQHLDESVHSARIRSSTFWTSFSSWDSILVIRLLSGLCDNIEMKSKSYYSNLEWAKMFPSLKSICWPQWNHTRHRSGRRSNKLISITVFVISYLVITTGICSKVSGSFFGNVSSKTLPSGWSFLDKGRTEKSIPGHSKEREIFWRRSSYYR
jgi:hypothetical protein